MKQKKFILPLLFAFSLLFSMSLVLGAVTLTVPVTGGNYTTVTFTCTKGIDDAPVNATQMAVFYNATGGTAGTGATRLGTTVLNSSLDDLSFEGAFGGIESLSDLATYNFTCVLGNATANVTSAGINLVTIDNTAPTCAFSINKNIVQFLEPSEVETTQSSTDATSGIASYSWIMYRSDDTQSQTSTSSAPTFSGTDFDQVGESTLALSITDYASNTGTCTSQSIIVQGSNGADVGSIVTTQQGILQRIGIPVAVIGGVIFLIIIATILIIVLSGGKN